MGRKIDRHKSISLTTGREKSKLIPSVSALNTGQKNVLRAIASPDNHIIMIDGPAGTGKTFISASWGLEQLVKERYRKMILTRPYVEAGEHLGFLPGEASAKMSVFLIPIFDVLHEHLSADDIKQYIEIQKIITLPLAYMRGTSFKDAFVILDEAQNTTIRQMHLFLTRIGSNSKLVITGDRSQSDLGRDNGFMDAWDRLQNINGLELVSLDRTHVVRHSIIPSIDERYSNKLGEGFPQN